MEDGKKKWKAPPRPSELKNIHVVELDTEKRETDYLALISSKTSASSKQTSTTQTHLPKISEHSLSTESLTSSTFRHHSLFKRTLLILIILSTIFVGTYFLIHSSSKLLPITRPQTTPPVTPLVPTPTANRDTLGIEKIRTRAVTSKPTLPPQEVPTQAQTNRETTQTSESMGSSASQPQTPENNPSQEPTPPSYPPVQPDPNAGVVLPPTLN